MNREDQEGSRRKGRADSDAIEWKDYPRIPPGEYRAYCKWGKNYRDPGFKRWLCLLRWDVLSDDLVRVQACVPQWFPLGNREKARASRRGKYLPEWVRANGGPPARRDRLSPGVFVYRMARVEIGDTEGPAPYSVVRRIIEWETGPPSHSVSKSTSQGRPVFSAVESEAFGICLSGLSEGEERDGVKGKPKGFSLLAAGEDSAFGESRTKHEAEREQFPPHVSFQASARAGVEGEHTPANTQGAGAPKSANPPKARETEIQEPGCEGFDIRCAFANDCNDGGYEDA
jgi:hypothetical protein